MRAAITGPANVATVFNKDKAISRIIKQLYGKKLGTSEGDIGHVEGFYFDDQKWPIRYVVVDTGLWLSGTLGADLSPCFQRPPSRRKNPAREPDSERD
jgi:hypothetical protein